jgi:hypothetical protein
VSREDFVAVAARLFAIYFLFLNVRGAPTAFQMLSQPDGVGWASLYAIIMVVLLIFTAFLWFFPLTIARKLLPVMRESRSATALDSSVVLSIGITLIGLWFLANSLSDASFWLALIVRTTQIGTTGFEWSHEQIAKMVSTAVELVISLGLVLGSSGVRQLIYRFRFGSTSDIR